MSENKSVSDLPASEVATKQPSLDPASMRWLSAASSAFAVVLWLSGPPFAIGPLVFIALVPLLAIAEVSPSSSWKRPLYAASLAYWLLSLQGLRYAHPLMFLPWIALSGYLAIYPVLFIALLRRLRLVDNCDVSQARRDRVPLCLVAAVVWVGLEWIRNYFFTGISVLMLGHALADMPMLIQIADLGGTYAVSFVIVCVNVAMFDALNRWVVQRTSSVSDSPMKSLVTAGGLLIATMVYGAMSMNAETEPTGKTIALLGDNELTVYEQDIVREQEIFATYGQMAIDAVAKSNTRIDAVVWPESMFSGGLPWMTTGADLVVPDFMQNPAAAPLQPEQLRFAVESKQNDFLDRANSIQRAMRASSTVPTEAPPAIIGGCGLVQYADRPSQYSGVVWVNATGNMSGTYSKNHLVLFGETIPLVHSLPWIRDIVPPGLGLDRGTQPERFDLDGISLMPNLCIETAVERIPVNHMHQLNSRANPKLPDAIVTLTNDVWFHDSAVVDHHLRCAQLVAVGCRRPILSAANGGPTVWIDSAGRVVERLAKGQSDVIYAQPRRDSRISLYVRIGSWPAGLMGAATLCGLAWMTFEWLMRRRKRSVIA
ncbi:MAG TPA: apolipoprotein N-acyltransferase [Rhodopirellula baltica]|nr:apolipoprotein N-acyltransferase [Rhodopirellula baltica]HBE63222.1 apolipoprotein N-acyltransferase [Rhodopirellula baltica]